jgi:hypothetical protein
VVADRVAQLRRGGVSPPGGPDGDQDQPLARRERGRTENTARQRRLGGSRTITSGFLTLALGENGQNIPQA